MRSLVPISTNLSRGIVVSFAILMLTAVGCGSEESEPTTTTAPPATSAATTTTTTAPATTATTTTTTAAQPELELPGPDEPWDLLFLAYGLTLGDAAPQMYAERAEQDLGVEVNLHNENGVYPDVLELLGHIGGGSYPDLSDPIRQAEIIVLQPAPHYSDGSNQTAINADLMNCSMKISTTDPKPPETTTAEYWQPYRQLLDAVYTEIWTLREGLPTVLIAIDTHDPYLDKQREAGIESQCTAWQEAWSSAEAQTAVENGAVMVSIYELLNGPGHDVDPVEMGYVGPTEQYPTIHWTTPNEVAAEMVVEALVAVGFEPWPIP